VTFTLSKKKEIVEAVSQQAKNAIAGLLCDYSGMSSNEMTLLRKQARQAGVYFKVIRNTLTKRAFEGTDLECLSDHLAGPLFVALSLQAPSDAARLIKDFSKQCENIKVKALSVGQTVYQPAQLDAVASLPTKDEAIAKLMAVMKAPIEKFVQTLAAPNQKLVRTLVAVKETM